VNDNCYEYLESQSSEWNYENDYWYKNECDPSYEYSKWKIKYEIASDSGSRFDDSLSLIAGLIILFALSYLVRWLITGKTKSD